MERDSNSSVQLLYLDTFVKTAELSSFTGAGKALGMTQAAVSQRIHALEAQLDIEVFDRKGGRIQLTEPGRRLFEYAQRILALHREAFEAVTGQRTPVSGELVLTASSIPGEHLLPGILSAFREIYPRIRVRVSVLDSMAALALVQRGKAHLGLVGKRVERAELEFQPIGSDELMLIVPEQHRWKRRREITFEQLADEPLVVREAGSGSRYALEQALQAHGQNLDDLRVALELGSNEAIKEALFAGLGVAVLSDLAVQKELATKKLHGLRIKELNLKRTFYLVRDARRPLPGPADLFVHFLRSSKKKA